MEPIDVEVLVYDDENEAEFAGHGVRPEEVEEVHANLDVRRFRLNRPDRRGSHVMLGETSADPPRRLIVPIEQWGSETVWRPVTAWEATAHQWQQYGSR